MLSFSCWSDNGNTVDYEGTLISLACVVDEEHPQEVNLGLIEEKRLYLHKNSAPVPFSLTLKDCDPSLANGINITLEATPGNETLDGYLQLDSSSVAKGAVIGIRDEGITHERIAIGSALPKYPVGTGTMRIPLSAYMHITPEALSNKSIVPGPFTATLYYQVSFE
ncbi:TPA: fimbrial protein [Providencia stuartii]|nr:fimbrial protein [Providencia stuartii]